MWSWTQYLEWFGVIAAVWVIGGGALAAWGQMVARNLMEELVEKIRKEPSPLPKWGPLPWWKLFAGGFVSALVTWGWVNHLEQLRFLSLSFEEKIAEIEAQSLADTLSGTDSP